MVGGSGGLTEYLVQQSQEFHRRVDKLDEQAKRIEDKLSVIEYNIVRLTDKLEEALANPMPNIGGDERYAKYIKTD